MLPTSCSMVSVFSLLAVLLLSSRTEAYNVFVYSAPAGFSHSQFTQSVIDTLAEAGHNVTVLMPVADNKVKKMINPAVRTVIVDVPEDIRKRFAYRTSGFWEIDPYFGNLQAIKHVGTIQSDFCHFLLSDESIVDQLNDVYDVGIIDFSGFCSFGLVQKIQIKNYIVISAVGYIPAYSEVYDTPVKYSYTPGSLLHLTDVMSFKERFFNLIWHIGSDIGFKHIFLDAYTNIFNKFGINFDFERDISDKGNYFLINNMEYLDYARPTSGKLKHIGGIAVAPAGPMPEEFEKVLASAKKGAIAMSFGSYATTADMPKEMKDSILHAIDELPDYQFIWRVDKADLKLSETHPNLKTVLWLPQRELLNDPRVKVYVSHAGMNSVLETALSGKPSLFVPIFADQFQNAGMMARLNSSKIIWKPDLKGDIVLKTLKELLEDESYAKNGRRLADLIKSSRSTPADILVEAVEKTGKFGKIHNLDTGAKRLNFFQLHSLDVISLIAFIVFLVFYIIMKILVVIFKFFFAGSKNKLKKL